MDTTELNDIEARILGSLMEKALATPEYYPLSLNALINACNQKSSRDPVMALDEHVVDEHAARLRDMGLVRQSNVSRVPKYEELFTRRHNMVPREIAVLCVLLLRGPQTIGEIRSRTHRLYAFKHTEALQETIASLESLEMVRLLSRQPGQKEARYTQRLSSPSEPRKPEASNIPGPVAVTDHGRLERLEAEIETVKRDLEELTRAFQSFKEQFE